MKAKRKTRECAVLGLGHFGMSVAEVLSEHGLNVLVCDNDPGRIQHAAAFATEAVQLDIGEEDELTKLELSRFDVVVVATGEDFEAALTAVTVAKEHGTPYVIVKAETFRQKAILEKLGADRVVFPEREIGEKIAHSLLNIDIAELFRNAGDFAIAEMIPDEGWIGKTVAESNIRARNIIILAIRRGVQTVVPVGASDVIETDDRLVVWRIKQN
jgi:trk system potassium uptake protein TrkA